LDRAKEAKLRGENVDLKSMLMPFLEKQSNQIKRPYKKRKSTESDSNESLQAE
jgi:hypothetical protein